MNFLIVAQGAWLMDQKDWDLKAFLERKRKLALSGAASDAEGDGGSSDNELEDVGGSVSKRARQGTRVSA